MATDTNVAQAELQGAERTRGGQVYRPQVDILEKSDELTLVADIPGVKSDAIDIDFEDSRILKPNQ